MTGNISEYWKNSLSFLKEETTDISFKTWIEPLTPSHIQNNIFYIEAPSELHKTTIESRFSDLIRNSINYANSVDLSVQIVTSSGTFSDDTGESADAFDETARKESYRSVSVFNEKYTFDSFIIGGNNMLAHAAAVAVAEAPSQSHNPLYIYGGSGLGKTHLLQAIGQYIIQNHQDKSVMYVTAEKYTNDLIEAIRNSRGESNVNEQFRAKYRNVDVLIIDDIQFLCGKKGSQEEFFHTFDTLYQENKQIVISCDQSPKKLEPLDDRLRTRFGWGLTADIQQPDLETRAAIIKRKSEDENIDLPDDVILYIADNIKTSIRDLEGALNRVVAFSSLTDKEMSLEIAQEALKDIIMPYQHVINCDTIISIVSRYYDIRIDEIKSTKRSNRVSYPRQIAMYLCRHYTELTLKELATAFGRDHTTIMHGVDKIEEDIHKKAQVAKDIDELSKTILYG